jgi:hypothetical protein
MVLGGRDPLAKVPASPLRELPGRHALQVLPWYLLDALLATQDHSDIGLEAEARPTWSDAHAMVNEAAGRTRLVRRSDPQPWRTSLNGETCDALAKVWLGGTHARNASRSIGTIPSWRCSFGRFSSS